MRDTMGDPVSGGSDRGKRAMKITGAFFSVIAGFLALYYNNYLAGLDKIETFGLTLNQLIFLSLTAVFIGVLAAGITVSGGGIGDFEEWLERLPQYGAAKREAKRRMLSGKGGCCPV